MPNGEEKNWTRLCAAVSGFHQRHGKWPEIAKLTEGAVDEIKKYCLTESQFNHFSSRLSIIVEESQVFCVENQEGLLYDYMRDGFPDGVCRESVDDWLLGEFIDEVLESDSPTSVGLFFSADGTQVAGPPADAKTIFEIKALNADFNFIELLQRHEIDPHDVLVMRHSPVEPMFAEQIAWIAQHREDVFIAYQSTQNPKEDKQLRKHRYLASFLAVSVGEAVFVGLYEVGLPRRLPVESIASDEAFVDLAQKFNGYQVTPEMEVFPMSPVISFKKLKGRLVIGWSGGVPGSRSWSRPATSKPSKHFPIFGIHPQSIFNEPKSTPDWRDIVLTLEEMKIAPEQWKQDFSKWRAIYYILDVSDGKAYVGSAGGGQNLWGRWSDYLKTGHGGNKLLKGRNSANFRFSILERIGPDISQEEVVRIENQWKARLHTMTHGLNSN